MKVIGNLVDQIEEELESAKDYAESYLEYKANKKDSRNEDISNKYKTLAEDEIRHAIFLHDIATIKINELSEVYTPPVEMLELWDKSHQKFIEKTAWIKQMLSM